MKTVDECPCAIINEDYPHEGWMTTHKCLIKKVMQGVCDEETTKGCLLFKLMQENAELKDLIQAWVG